MIETNTAITGGTVVVNNEITLVEEQVLGIINLISIINNSLLPSQTKLTMDTLAINDIKIIMNSAINDLGPLSDLIIQRGKDILLLADQANQFICVSNDAFDRVIDNWNWMNSNEMHESITNGTTKLKNLVLSFRAYLDTRKLLISNDQLAETQLEISSRILLITKSIDDDVIKNINNIKNICKLSYSVCDVFKNVLSVNSTVGIALSVTERSWGIMKRMNQHNYSTVTTELPIITQSETSNLIETNLLYPISMINREKQVDLWLNKMLILASSNSQIISNNKIYKFTNKIDKESYPFDLPKDYNTLTDDQVRTKYRSKNNLFPEILSPLMEKIGLINIMNITTTDIETFYGTLSSPGFTLAQLLLEFSNNTFSLLYNKFNNGSVIQEFINNFNNKKQYQQMRNSLIDIESIVYDFIDTPFINSTVYNFDNLPLSNGTLVQKSFQLYLNHKFSLLNGTLQHTNKISELKNLYTQKLELETGSGQLTITQYSIIDGIEKADKVIDQFKYNYLLYKDNFKIHYLEARVNKNDYFVLDDNLLQCLYTYNEELVKSITFVSNALHKVEIKHIYKSFLNGYNVIVPTFDIDIMNILVDGIIEDKLNGIKKALTTTYTNEKLLDGLHKITKVIKETDTETHWVTNNFIERVTVDITNIYREELLNSRMDFSQARINSIISTLRYLGYREELDQYIDDTWTYGIPRYVTQK